MPQTRIITRSKVYPHTGEWHKHVVKHPPQIAQQSRYVLPSAFLSVDGCADHCVEYSVQRKHGYEYPGQRLDSTEAAHDETGGCYDSDYNSRYKIKQKRLLSHDETGCLKRSEVKNCDNIVDNSKCVFGVASGDITSPHTFTNFMECIENGRGLTSFSQINSYRSSASGNTLHTKCSRYRSRIYIHGTLKRGRKDHRESLSIETYSTQQKRQHLKGLEDIAQRDVHVDDSRKKNKDKEAISDIRSDNFLVVSVQNGIQRNNRDCSVCPFTCITSIPARQDTKAFESRWDVPSSETTSIHETCDPALDSLQGYSIPIDAVEWLSESSANCRRVDNLIEGIYTDSVDGVVSGRLVEIVVNSLEETDPESADTVFDSERSKALENFIISDVDNTENRRDQVRLSQTSDTTSTDSELAMTSMLRDGMADITCGIMALSTRTSRHKTRRRSTRTPGKVDSTFLPRSTCDTSSQTTTTDGFFGDSDEKSLADHSLNHSSPSSSLDPTTVSKFSSVERLRQCSSPNFIYDPEIARQIPFYFVNPDIEDLHHESVVSYSWCHVHPLDSDFDSKHFENCCGASEVFDWEEFDDCNLRSIGKVGMSPPSHNELTGVDSCNESAYITNSSVQSEEAALTDSSSEVLEIDYDNYLPAHVLMHVKRDLVSVLMEYGQTREVKVAFKDMERSGPHHASRFHTAAIVDGETFPVGSGSSKKNAKKAAAAQALKIMYDRGRKNLEVVNEAAHKKLKAMSDDEVGSHAHRVVLVSRHVLDTAEETQFINYSKDKIAATFVLEYHGRMRVVGLGTGNRCILYQHLTLDGKRVIHSHAEIIARRAFLRYLFKQLLTYNGNRSHPIFTRSDTGKLKLRDKIQVHLYISRPPCGDAAAFPTISNFPNKMRAIRKQGQLRTIIDDGEGAIPTDFPVPAGANGKERLRIMTCSDKICRWNVLGVQGALLSHFLDPIFISSLVIGSHTGDQRGHVPRAVSGRLKCGRLHEVIQRPYHINTPDIHYPHDDLADNYNITKSKQYCITWSYGDSDAEVIDAITGVTNMETMEEVIPSRVSKITLYNLFQQVCKKYGQHDLASLDYLKAKRAATTFQRMKSFVGQHLAAMGFGQWYSLQDTYGTDSLTCPGPC